VVATLPLVAAMTPAPTPVPTLETMHATSTPGTVVDDRCQICPNGPTPPELGDFIPSNWDTRTCEEIINDSKLVPSGTVFCALAQFGAMSCCPSEPVNPCSICPNGATDDLDDSTPFKEFGYSSTCSELMEVFSIFETESELYGVIGSRCCPTSTVVNPAQTPSVATPAPTSTASGGNNGTVLVMAIPAVSVISFMALAIY
jgi:hypothetical protein